MSDSIKSHAALESLYVQALAHEKAGDFDRAAHYYRQMLVCDAQDHGGAAVRLASIGYGPTPKSAPSAYIATLFDQHAEVFDLILVDQLEYDVPEQVRQSLEELAPGRIFARLLDLGCGTGLCGEALDDLSEHKSGLDLSENMIAVAHEKGDYDQLWVGDAVHFLTQKQQEKWDLITATDVLPYMGEIEEFFQLVGEHLEQDGIFAFSSETLPLAQFDGADYKVGPFQRFAHQASYIEACLSQAGLGILQARHIVVRQEQGHDVHGQLFVSIKA